MSIETTGPVPEANQALKSTDTSTRVKVEVPKPEPVKEVKPEPVIAEPSATPVEGESTATTADPTPKDKEYRRDPRWVREKLDRVRQETEARTREAVLREFQANQPKTDVAPVAEGPKAKTLEDFNFDQDAYTDYLVETKLTKREQAAKLEAENKERAKAAESFKAKIDAFEERAGDGTWQDIVESPLNTDPAYKPLTELFMGDEHDLDIAHYLAENLKEADRIKALPRLQQVREVAKLAEKFEGGSQEEVDTPSKPAPLPKKTTTAPPPPKTVSGAGKPSVDINDPNISTAQRIAAWRQARKR